ncbi:MAG: choline dehydrogenase [Rhodospirillales bacterium]
MVENDYVVVGAGSAGAVVASRLSENPSVRVLLLEAGPRDGALSLRIPSAMAANLKGTRYNWAYQGEPEPGLGGRSLQHDRGKGLGGSSSINGMVFIRGHARDFDGWRQLGCDGWGYADVLPYFKRLETYDGGADTFRGGGGPMRIKQPAADHPLTEAFLKAGEQAGYPITEDICGYRQEGFGRLDRSTWRGERWSTARAYLDPARGRPNLTIMTGVRVDRLTVDDGRVTGVEGIAADGGPFTARVNREVVVSAGAVATPQLLMQSGIGPAEHLREVGIAPLLDRPGVGANLNEHPDFVLKYACRQPISLWPVTRPFGRLRAGLQWLLTRGGVCASNHFEAVACIRSGAGIDYPDIQLTTMPLAMQDDTWEPVPCHAFQIHVGLMRARSRGTVHLRDGDPASPPRITVNYLTDPEDRRIMRTGIRLTRELIAQPAYDGLRGKEIFPGEDVRDDDDLDRALAGAVATQWHLSGTARMGRADDRNAVVDKEGRVIGLGGCRIVDASVMPVVTNGNTNAPTIMIAEKLSDAIRGVPPLPPIEADVWQNPEWDKRQR